MNIQSFDFNIDLLQALLWQYNDAENLQELLEQKYGWYYTNYTEFWNSWLRDVFDLRTANDFGLSVWSIILGMPLNVTPEPIDNPTFGFGEDNLGFDEGSFGIGDSTVINLTTKQARLVLRLRYYQLVSRGIAAETNAFLKEVFADYGTVYIGDSQDMDFSVYIFLFYPDQALRFILENFDILPRPSGVGIAFTYNPEPNFGFEAGNLGFDEGSFGG